MPKKPRPVASIPAPAQSLSEELAALDKILSNIRRILDEEDHGTVT